MSGVVHHPPGGARLLAGNETGFRLWAPGCEAVFLEVEGQPPLTMAGTRDGWFETVAYCGAGARYRYRVAPEPLGLLVAEAYEIGTRAKLDPTLILAVMAIESRFNPFAQSPVGAQGLMQVMTRVHTDKYEALGGHLAAFDPVTNLRVGVKVLQDCITRAGSVQGGLAYYVGATDPQNDGGYAEKVLAEHYRLRQVASTGRAVPPTQAVAPPTLATQAPAKTAPAAASPAPGASSLGEKVALLSATDL